MSYIHCARGLAGVSSEFQERLAEDLGSNDIAVDFENETIRSRMFVRYRDETGQISVKLSGPDLEISFCDLDAATAETTSLSLLVAEGVSDIDDEMRAFLETGDEEEEVPTAADLSQKLWESFQELLAVRDEIDLLTIKGEDVGRPERRVGRVERLYEEASCALKQGDLSGARRRILAMQVMIEKAEESLGNIGG